ncbi:MAG: RNA 2',3'-cyclic phosphodiesterase [Patescibacteria group bacterium]
MGKRIFIAIPLPKDTQQIIRNVQEKLQKFNWPVRWEPAEKLHITLQFLGSIFPEELRAVGQIASRSVSGRAPFIVGLRGFTVLPSAHAPHVICIKGVASYQLAQLQSSVAAGLAKQEIGKPERRPFSGHVTIGRISKPGANYRILEKLEFDEHFKVHSVQVVESVLQPERAHYTVIRSFPLRV